MRTPAANPKVLVIRGGAIGDFILTLPAIRLLKENIANAHLEVLGYKPITELAVAAGLADATRNLEHASMAKLFVPNATLEEALLEWLKSFNLIVSYLYDPDGILRANMERTGVKTYLDCPQHVAPGKGHAAEQLAKPLEKLAMFLDDPAPVIHVRGAAEGTGDKKVLAVHPGSGSLRKNLPVEHWIALGKEMAKSQPEWRLALITGEAEHERGITEQMKEGWRGIDFLHWDQRPLTELAARLTQCTGFAGHDSGVSHLAAACGVRCLLFFGPTDPATWAPRNAGVQVIVEPLGNLAEMPYGTVWARVRELLSEME